VGAAGTEPGASRCGAFALGVSATTDPSPSKTGDLEVKDRWKSVQNIQNISLVGLLYFCWRRQRSDRQAASGAPGCPRVPAAARGQALLEEGTEW